MKPTTHAAISATATAHAVVAADASVIPAHLGDHSGNCVPIPARGLRAQSYDQGVSEDLIRPGREETSCREIIRIAFPVSIRVNVAVSPTVSKLRSLGDSKRRQEEPAFSNPNTSRHS